MTDQHAAARTGDRRFPEPRLAIVCGHQRSGTTMLRQLLNTHPEVMLTMEFRNFTQLGAPVHRYASRVLWHQWKRDVVSLTHGAPRWRSRLDGAAFVLLYALGILVSNRGGRVTLKSIRSTLHMILPWARVVGDKYPGYIYRLDRLATRPDVRCVVIYRDCRDVVSSTLTMAATAWKDSLFASTVDTPAKVAARWVTAIAQQERNAGAVLSIRYEDLVLEPGPIVARLGEFLELDPSGFRQSILRPTSIGKHRQALTREDLEVVNQIAGETMSRLGYH